MYPWQQSVMDILTGPEDDRTIYWITEPIGSVGKTKTKKHLKQVFPHVLTVEYESGMNNMKYLIAKRQEELKNAQTPAIAIIDIPRSHTVRNPELYQALEVIKDGDFTSGKYEGAEISLPIAMHVIVFSNEAPVVDMLSVDRWKVYNIHPDDLTLEHM